MGTVDVSSGSSANEAAILNTVMYLDIKQVKAVDGEWNMKRITEALDNSYGDNVEWSEAIGEQYNIDKAEFLSRKEQFSIIYEAVKQNPHLADLVIDNQSSKITDQSNDVNAGFNKTSGLNACTFSDKDGTVYVVYRGTGSGEWIDNGEGLSGIPEENTYYEYDGYGNVIGKKTITEYATDQQAQALNYFNYIAAKNNFTSDNNIIVTGHSKGGNKSQYVTLNSDLVDTCYSFDGQGFSPEALEYYKKKYGEEYKDVVNKMYSLSADNDYVNILGNRAVPDDHILYFEAPEADEDTKKYHYMNAMLSSDGSFNPSAKQGDLSKFLEKQSNDIMAMDPEERQYITRGLMDVAQSFLGKGVPVNGDNVSDLDMYTGLLLISPSLIHDLFNTPDGIKTLITAFKAYDDELAQLLIDKLNEYREKHGLFETAVVALAAAYIISFVAPIIVKTVAILEVVLWTCRITYELILFLKNTATELVDKVIDYMEKLVNGLMDWYNNNLNSGYKYATQNPYIQVNTNKLRDYAGRLAAVNARIDSLDRRLNTLYSKVSIWDWWTIFKVDALTGYSWRLLKCVNYLNDTAAEFEAVEAKLLTQIKHA